jgi:PAS domain-containing protein
LFRQVATRLPRTGSSRPDHGPQPTVASVAIVAENDRGVGKKAMALPIQIILIRQLAGYLGVPLFLVDPKGDLLFYNEPAEAILGRRFEETGPMPAKTWSTAFTPVDEQGRSIPPENLPLMIVLATRRPAHLRHYIHGLNGVRRYIDVTSIPIVGLRGEFLGAASLYWEIE